MPQCCSASLSVLMPALLAAGDESAMNFEGLGVFFRHIHWFPQHFCELGAKKLHRAGHMGLAN
jgi:hypothetical protein